MRALASKLLVFLLDEQTANFSKSLAADDMQVCAYYNVALTTEENLMNMQIRRFTWITGVAPPSWKVGTMNVSSLPPRSSLRY